MSRGAALLTVRAATATDDADLAALEQAAWSPVGDFPSARDRPRGPFFSADNPPEHHLVAALDGVVVGYVRLRPPTPLPENAHVLGIFGFAVHPAARGRGIGSRLLAAAEDVARRRGTRKLMLRVLSHNEVARRLYERHGFVVEGVLREEFLIEGRYVDDIVMAKHLYAAGPAATG